ncbi:MAG: hypothetical protein E7593_00270 [Ruminococcaceae bacterium]|nr:hypothetical protein [Oscillospiraceae bacterium]
MKNKPFITGIISIVSPIPMFIFTILWCWVWFFGIGIGLLNYDTVPQWILVLSLLPLLISPILCLTGIFYGIVKIKARKAVLGIFLSVAGLLENFILIYGMYYLGSRF